MQNCNLGVLKIFKNTHRNCKNAKYHRNEMLNFLLSLKSFATCN